MIQKYEREEIRYNVARSGYLLAQKELKRVQEKIDRFQKEMITSKYILEEIKEEK